MLLTAGPPSRRVRVNWRRPWAVIATMLSSQGSLHLVPEVQEAAAAVVLSELERLLLEHEAAANNDTAEKKQADDARLALAEHYTGVLYQLLQPDTSPLVAVDAEAPPLPCLTGPPGSHTMRLRSLVVCSLVLERVLSPPKGSPKLTVYERQYQLLVRWHLKTHVYEAMLEPDVVQEEGAVDIDQEHPLETTLAAPETPQAPSKYMPEGSSSGTLSLVYVLDRSPGACLRLAVSARHEDGLVKVIDLPQLIRSSVGCRDAVTPEEYYHDDSRWQMEIEKSVINSNTNLPTGTKIVPSERTRFLIGESSAANHLGSGLPLRPDCRLYAKDVMLLSLGIDWPIGNNITGLFDRINHDTVSDDEPLPVSNSLTAHPTASVFASATNSGVRVWSFGCPALDEPARPLCLFESPKRPSFRDTLRVASWSDDGGMLAGISKKGRMSVWSSCRPGKPIISFNSPFIRGNDVKALTPSGSLMLICGRQSPSGSGGAAMVDCRSPELVVQKWNAGPGLEYTCASGLSQPQELQLGTCDGRVVDLDTRAGGRSKTVMFYGDDHDRSPAIHSLLRYGTDQDGIVAVTHGSAVGVLQAGKDAGSFDSEYTMHKGGMKSAVKAAFSKIGPKLVAAADACGTVAITAGASDEQLLLHRLP
ncbi:Dmx-like 1 [Perkinsus olseni]|uniref:Dmx-like 1 n=1 Tax=Perkinsus olseni TaxID=32597 RepID=A0A7J6NQ42_PEROL|nr:Dmx-like 1 [Perkinsus olseni]